MHSDVVTLPKARIWQEASQIVGEEGFRAFWKGNLVTIAHRLPYFLSFFMHMITIKRLVETSIYMSVSVCVCDP